mmetsp:Transcript_47108/g.105692  ORF Transcript_47108/g.105692 Transcript_47108/m.105692 type:complete len:225 (-) Transcript_47108:127-801(-)
MRLLVVAVSAVDHTLFYGLMLLSARDTGDVLIKVFPATLALSLANGLVRLVQSPGSLPRFYHLVVLTLHATQMAVLSHFMGWLTISHIRGFIECLVASSVLALDMIHVSLAAKQTAEEEASRGNVLRCTISQPNVPPAVERFQVEASLEQLSSSTCAICLDEVCLGNEVARLSCQHTFHAACVDMWFEKVVSPPPWCPFRCTLKDVACCRSGDSISTQEVIAVV